MVRRGFVVTAAEGTRRRRTAPRVFVGLGGRGTGTATTAAPEEPPPKPPPRLRRDPPCALAVAYPERRADLVDLDLDDGALLPSRVSKERCLSRPVTMTRAPGEALGHVLGGFAPNVAPQEQRFAVLPLPALAVVDPGSTPR